MSIGEKLQRRLEEVTAERDALAAQVRTAQIIAGRWQDNDDNIGQTLTALEVWALRSDSDPNGALARLKAEWQADELRLLADGADDQAVSMWLRSRAAVLLRQSEPNQ